MTISVSPPSSADPSSGLQDIALTPRGKSAGSKVTDQTPLIRKKKERSCLPCRTQHLAAKVICVLSAVITVAALAAGLGNAITGGDEGVSKKLILGGFTPSLCVSMFSCFYLKEKGSNWCSWC